MPRPKTFTDEETKAKKAAYNKMWKKRKRAEDIAGHRSMIYESNLSWRERNKEAYKAYQREYQRKWRKANPIHYKKYKDQYTRLKRIEKLQSNLNQFIENVDKTEPLGTSQQR